MRASCWRRCARREGVHYKATCANVRAVERALADLDAGFGVNEISLLVSASEAHSMKNLRQSRAAQWENVQKMAAARRAAFGWSAPSRLRSAARSRARSIPLSWSPTPPASGTAASVMSRSATPPAWRRLRASRSFSAVCAASVPGIELIAHLHDTRGTGLVNALAAYEAGVRYFDCSFGGVGGHPAQVQYGGGYTGNVCTEDLVNLFELVGIRTGIDLEGLIETSRLCEQALGRELFGRVTRTGLNPLRSEWRVANSE